MKPETILCSIEFGEIKGPVLSTSKFLAKEWNAHLYILHVIEKIDLSIARVLGYENRIEKFMKQEGKKKENRMLEIVKEMEAEGIKAEARIRYGKPHTEIIETAEEIKPGFIVMGTQTKGGIESYFIGSNTWRVIESKKFPVLTTRTSLVNPPENILVPLDLSDISFKAISYAKEFKKKFNSKLYFLHVLVMLESMAKWEAVEKMEEEIKRKMGDVSEEGEILVEKSPDAASGILKAIRDISANLIIMTTHGRGGIEKALFGSVTERVIRESEIPVLSLPPV